MKSQLRDSSLIAALLVASLVGAPVVLAAQRGYERDLQSTMLDMRLRREQSASSSRLRGSVDEIFAGLRQARAAQQGPTRLSNGSEFRTPSTPTSGSTAPRTMTNTEMFDVTRAAADKGDAGALVKLGHMHATAYAGTKNLPAAFAEYSAAAAKGNADGQAYRGILLMVGEGVARDSAAAMVSLRKAAAQGNATAQEWVDAYAPESMTPEQRVATFRKSAERGDPVGMEWMGYLYERGQGVTKNDSASLSWYTRAADAGSVRAQLEIGSRYATGTGGTTKDEVKAHQIYRTLADNGNSKAMLRMGYDFVRGVGIAVDTVEAVKWFTRAADLGEGRGAYEIGTLYRNGSRAVPRNLATARSWFERGETMHYALASYNLGVGSILGEAVKADTLDAVRHFALAADAGYQRAASDLGFIYGSGMGPVKKDVDQALHWQTVAALLATTPADVAEARKQVVALGGDGAALDAAVSAANAAKAKAATERQ